MSVLEGRMPALVVLAAVTALSGSGCVEVSLREGQDMDYRPVSRPVPPRASEGTIWRGSPASGSFLLFDQKAREIGDLVTVTIVEQIRAEGSAKTQADSDGSLSATILSDVGFQGLISVPLRGLFGLLGFSAGRDRAEGTEETNLVTAKTTNSFDGEGKTSRSNSFTGVVTCRVIEVLPGGLLHIRGRRSVVINHESQLITLEGLVRRQDISISNNVSSTSVAELRLTYDGLGVLDDKQRPGLVARIFDWVHPF